MKKPSAGIILSCAGQWSRRWCRPVASSVLPWLRQIARDGLTLHSNACTRASSSHATRPALVVPEGENSPFATATPELLLPLVHAAVVGLLGCRPLPQSPRTQTGDAIGNLVEALSSRPDLCCGEPAASISKSGTFRTSQCTSLRLPLKAALQSAVKPSLSGTLTSAPRDCTSQATKALRDHLAAKFTSVTPPYSSYFLLMGQVASSGTSCRGCCCQLISLFEKKYTHTHTHTSLLSKGMRFSWYLLQLPKLRSFAKEMLQARHEAQRVDEEALEPPVLRLSTVGQEERLAQVTVGTASFRAGSTKLRPRWTER
eukprot:scaffold556_cov221-Pinguiococcus_pyrenoidosus.AAC.12